MNKQITEKELLELTQDDIDKMMPELNRRNKKYKLYDINTTYYRIIQRYGIEFKRNL